MVVSATDGTEVLGLYWETMVFFQREIPPRYLVFLMFLLKKVYERVTKWDIYIYILKQAKVP